MKKIAVILISIVAVSMMLMAVSSVMAARPERKHVIVRVRDTSGNPITGVTVYLRQDNQKIKTSGATNTNPFGNANLYLKGGWHYTTPVSVWIYDTIHQHYHAYPNYYLDKQLNGDFTITHSMG